ncbi:uncharacterized protein ko isoform X2 [Panulirus ornatus]
MGESFMLHQRCLAIKLERDLLLPTCLPPGCQNHTQEHQQPVHKARIYNKPKAPIQNQCSFDVTTPTSSSSSSSSDSDTATPTNGLLPSLSRDSSSASTASYLCSYQDGYHLFLAWQAANSVCVWDKELMMAVQECEYVGYLVGGVLLVGGHHHILATLIHAWSRALLAPPTGFNIIMLGEISDWSVVSVPQGQFTPLADALCWVIHRLTKDGGCAEADAVQAYLTTAFPNLNAPDPAHVHTTLSNLIRQCKVYYSGHSYGIVQPHTYQLTAMSGLTLPSTSLTLSPIALSSSHLLMDAVEECCRGSSTLHQLMGAGKECGQADFICEDGLSHAAVQTDLAELITGASQPTDVLITPKLSESWCEESSAIEKQLSMQILSSHCNAARTASLRHTPTKAALLASAFASVSPRMSSYTTNTYQAHDMSDVSVRGERGSVLSKLLRVSPRRRLGYFSAQFPPPEWTDEAAPMVHLHCLATQTSSHNKQEENESWWSTTLKWAPRSATLPRRMRRPHSATQPVSQISDSSPAQVHMSYPHIQGPSCTIFSNAQSETPAQVHMSYPHIQGQPFHFSSAQSEASSSHYLNIETKESSVSSPVNCNMKPLASLKNKRYQSPVHQSNENCKQQSPVQQNIENQKHHLPFDQNNENCRHHSQIHFHNKPHKDRSSIHQSVDQKKSHSRQGLHNSVTTRNQLHEHPPQYTVPKSNTNTTKAPTQTVKRQSLSQCSKPEKGFREKLGEACLIKSGDLHIKKSDQIVARKLRKEQVKKVDDCTQKPREMALKEQVKKVDDCTQKPREMTVNQRHTQRLHHGVKGKNQKEQESSRKTQVVDSHQRFDQSCQNLRDIVVNYGNEKVQKNHAKSNNNNPFENKEEKDQKMLDAEESEKEHLFHSSQREEDFENNESFNEHCQMEMPKREGKSGRNSKNYDRSSLQLELGVTHMNNSRKVVSSPQRLEGLKNNMLHDGSALTDISKGSSHNLTSRNLCYQEVDKCHKELCSRTLDQVQQQSVSQVKQRCGTSTSRRHCSPSSKKKMSPSTDNCCDNSVIVTDNKNLKSKDENCSIREREKVNSTPDIEGISLSTYPSLSELNINFSSLAAQKILCGASINSIDTLMEVNLAAEKCKKHSESVTSTDFGFV